MGPKVGSFFWLELATSDQNAAKDFYSKLFDWTVEDRPMGPMTYTMCRLNGKDAAGIYSLMPEQVAAHVPPHWMLYVGVDNADASAERAVQLGAKTIVPPSDIPNVGKFAVLQDPTGAIFSMFQPGEHHGIEVFGENNALCWADLNTNDPVKAADFYAGLFGWRFETGKDGYRHIVNGASPEDMIGGIPPQMHAPPGTPSHWAVYFRADDCKASAEKAASLGARALMPATLMENVGTMAVLADPQGAVFSLFQSARG
ncbi:MAG TPA: VOC family protein [Terriglobia bacterium]|nr:VOC family protein [Terriglobia bacterium]